MILSKQEQEYMERVDETLHNIIDDTEAAKGTPEDAGVLVLSLIAKQQAQTNALLVHMINFMEGKEPDARMGKGRVVYPKR